MARKWLYWDGWGMEGPAGGGLVLLPWEAPSLEPAAGPLAPLPATVPQVWASELAPSARLGALIRSRPLAVRVGTGGCSLLLVHAGAFPWMLDAVDRLAGANTTLQVPGVVRGRLRVRVSVHLAVHVVAV